jgi:hypothetical protein
MVARGCLVVSWYAVSFVPLRRKKRRRQYCEVVSKASRQRSFSYTYRTITTLLTEKTLPGLVFDLLSFLELTDAGVHALGHVIVGRVLGLGNVEKLNSELADAVGWSSDDTTTLALDTADTTVVDSPLVETGNVDSQRTPVCLALVVTEAHVSTRKRAISANQVVKKIPSGSFLVALGCGLSFLLLLKSKAVSLLLRASLLLLALLGG